jgi:cytochrome c oxidase subunit 4
MAQHILPQRTYLLVFAALIVLTAATVGASFLPLGGLHLAVALTIAIAKATLVLLFFMHLLYSTRLTWVVALSGLLWLGILIVLTMADYVTREVLALPGR